MKFANLKHPLFQEEEDDWEKFRDTYEGGRCFVNKYLKTFSTREDKEDFKTRKDLTYCPNFAGAAITEVKNVIFNRLRDVVRRNKSVSYTDAIQGKRNGVDNAGSSMDYFIGQYITPELLTMRRVGVYVDMVGDVPKFVTPGMENIHPYLYMYQTEEILSWSYADIASPKEFKSILLREDATKYDSATNFPVDKYTRYRWVELNPDGQSISVRLFDDNDKQINLKGDLEDITYTVNIPEIPFVMFEISKSLMKDIADYQIALLNMESADVAYAVQANFPIYVEEKGDGITDFRDIPALTEEQLEQGLDDVDKAILEAKNTTEKVGPTYGKRYPKGGSAPSYIHPSPEPLAAAMEKEKQIKKDIKLLINLAITDLSDKMESEDSKRVDESGKQTGLACVAYVLEKGERQIAKYWNYYDGTKDSDIIVTYPKDYDLKSDDDRRKDAGELFEMLERVPSLTYKKQILKQIVHLLLAHKIPDSILDTINTEIDNAKSMLSSVELLVQCIDKGLITVETASLVTGMHKDEVKKAKKELADRQAAIMEAQGGVGGDARGVKEFQTKQPSSSDEKDKKNKRGPGK